MSHFNTLCERITEAWDHVVLKVEGEGEGKKERELRAVFVLGTIVAGWEVGFSLPAVRTPPSSLFSFHISIYIYFFNIRVNTWRYIL